ncbi:MAG: family 20 glycosylhydrolase [Acidobacteriota bacterium]|nr:family 20 glycosylhydrolase [Acidobacteriota bacterium]
MASGDTLLHPRPQRFEDSPGACVLRGEVRLSVLAPDELAAPALEILEPALEERGLQPRRVERGGQIRLVIDPAPVERAQGYRLHVGEFGVELVGSDTAGLLYGVFTLVQWLRAHPPLRRRVRLPGLMVEDWPDFAHRGVMLDISRDKVPTKETLEHLVELLACWKINQLQLYMEHTFAYAGHEEVWQGVGALTAEDVRWLDDLCRRRCIELVPNQNSFGHFHRWLVLDRYRPLAECPEGQPFPFGDEERPFSLCPTDPKSLELLRDLYAQLLPNFRSRLFNVGCDETFDLGKGRSAEACRRRGREEVYLDFLRQVRDLAAEHGRRIQFWGDIIIERPDLIPELPKDAVALEWGYEADHSFEEHAAAFGRSGLEFYVCPGTSSWSSLTGRPDNAVANLASAAEHGLAHGASGYLITDWGDFGHLQPLPVSYPGLLAGAGCAWNVESRKGLAERLPALLDHHVFHDLAGRAGQALWDLGAAHGLTGARPFNGSPLFFQLVRLSDTLDEKRYQGMTKEGLEEARDAVQAGRKALAKTRLERPDAELVLRELRWAADLLLFAIRLAKARLKAGKGQPLDAVAAKTRQCLADRLAPLLPEYREIWLARNRPGGLDDSAGRLEQLLAELRG